MDDVIERIKETATIEQVVSKLGYQFERDHGASRRVAHVGGLVVNTQTGRYFWAGKGWNGDAIDLVMRHEGLEFVEAVNWLADMAGVERPNWGRVDQAVIRAVRAREHIFDVAARVFVRWLQDDAEALRYVRGRGLSDETISGERLGFSGRGMPEQYQDMRGEFSLYGVDPETPAAVAILGYRGDVMRWAKGHDVNPQGLDAKWIERGYLTGLMSTPGIIYTHTSGRRLTYFSRRQLPGFDRITTDSGELREWKSWNPPAVILGERQFYFNKEWKAEAQECLIVEGQMDAITLGQWGFAAVALCGLGSSPEALAGLKARLSKHLVLYLALDADPAGQARVRKLGMLFGPMTRIVRIPEGYGRGKESREERGESGEGKGTQEGTSQDKQDRQDEGRAPSRSGTQALRTDQARVASQSLATTEGKGLATTDLGTDLEKARGVAKGLIAEGKKVTVVGLQRALRIAYPTARRLMDELLKEGGQDGR